VSKAICVECVDGPCDGHEAVMEMRSAPLEERTFLFARVMESGEKVISAYAWKGEMRLNGVALLHHVIEVGTIKREGAP